MKQPNVAVHGSQAREDTQRAREILDRRQVPYGFRDVDETPEYNDSIANLNGGNRVTPMIRVDNETPNNPSRDELLRRIEQSADDRR